MFILYLCRPQNQEILVNWINSFDYPNCQSISTINDLKDGIALCELIYDIFLRTKNPDFPSHVIVNQINRSKSIANISLALCQIKLESSEVPQNLMNISPDQIFDSEELMVELIQHVYMQWGEQNLNREAHEKKRQSRSSSGEDRLKAPNSQASQPPLPSVSKIKQKTPNTPGSQHKENKNYSMPMQYNMNQNNDTNNSEENYTLENDANDLMEPEDDFQYMKGKSYIKSTKDALERLQQNPKVKAKDPNHEQAVGGELNIISNLQGENVNSLNWQNQGDIRNNNFVGQYSGNFAKNNFPNQIFQQNNAQNSGEEWKPSPFKPQSHILNNNPNGEQFLQLYSSQNGYTQKPIPQQLEYSPIPTNINVTKFGMYSGNNAGKGSVNHNRLLSNNSEIMGLEQRAIVSSSFDDATPYRSSNIPFEAADSPYVTVDQFQKDNLSAFVAPNYKNSYTKQSDHKPQLGYQSGHNANKFLSSGGKNSNFLNSSGQDVRGFANYFNDDNNYQNDVLFMQPPHPYIKDNEPQQIDLKKIFGQEKSQILETSTTTRRKDEKQQIQIFELSINLKQKVLDWLISINLIKNNVRDLVFQLPQICQNGVILSDLLNRLEGKHEILKGISRRPKNNSQILTNYNKVFDYLQQFEQMNPRYLNAQHELMEGNQDVFYGVIDDIRLFYGQQISPFDPRFNPTLDIKPSSVQQSKNHEKSSQHFASIDDQFSHFTSQQAILNDPENQQQINQTIEYDEIYANQSNHIKSQQYLTSQEADQSQYDISLLSKQQNDPTSPAKAKQQTQYATSNTQVRSTSNSPMKKYQTVPTHANERDQPDSFETIKSKVISWLQGLGFQNHLQKSSDSTNFLTNPIKNGTLLCYLLSRMQLTQIDGMERNPKKIEECKKNFEIAYTAIRCRQLPIPIELLWRGNDIIKGREDIVWNLLNSLMVCHQSTLDFSCMRQINTSMIHSSDHNIVSNQKYQNAPNNSSQIHNSTHCSTHFYGDNNIKFQLPYSDQQLQQLKYGLAAWIQHLGVLFEMNQENIQQYQEMELHIRSGVLLCLVVQQVCEQKIIGIFRKPLNFQSYFSNVNKALQVIKRTNGIAHRYFIREEDVVNGNRSIILCILEDLLRFYDNIGTKDITSNNFLQFEEPYLGQYIRNYEEKKMIYNQKADRNIEQPRYYEQQQPEKEKQFKLKSNNSPRFLNGNPNNDLSDFEKLLSKPYSIMSKLENGVVHFPHADGARENDHANQNQQQIQTHVDYDKENRGINRSTTNILNNHTNIESSQQANIIKTWLNDMGLQTVSKFINFNGEYLSEFQDGQNLINMQSVDFSYSNFCFQRVLLSQIVEILQKKNISGINQIPKSSAASLFNIKKILGILKLRPEMNYKFLQNEDIIFEGRTQNIIEFLSHIKHAYRNTTQFRSDQKIKNQ